tara:strand:+ start:231 stop:425 length:195 start_codon:yes stop_codon:yes gene_type:complete
MQYKRSNYVVNPSLAKASDFSKSVDITNLIRRNKTEQQKDKLLQIFGLLGGGFLIIILLKLISI